MKTNLPYDITLLGRTVKARNCDWCNEPMALCKITLLEIQEWIKQFGKWRYVKFAPNDAMQVCCVCIQKLSYTFPRCRHCPEGLIGKPHSPAKECP